MDKKKISIAVVAVLVCLLICIAAIGQLVPKDRDPEEGSDTALPAEVLDLINNYMSAFKKGTDKSVEYICMENEFKRSAYINSGDMLIDYKIESFEKINDNLYGLVVLTKTEQSMMTFGDVYRSVFNFVAYIDGEWRYINGVANIPADIRENLDVNKYTYDDEHIIGAEDIVEVIDSVSNVGPMPSAGNINESSNPIFNTSEELPISDLAMSVAVPDFLTDEQQTLYRRAYTLYQAMFGGDTLGIDSFDGASEAYELYASERAETAKLDGIEYLLAVNRYRNWESFDSTIHAVFTDSFWAEKNKVTYSDDLVVSIYRESEGRLAMLSFSRGSGMYYNPNFPDEFELKRKTDTSISFSLFGHYSFMYPLEGEAETERDSRVENGFEVTYEFPIRMVQTDAGWRFDEFHSALADEWIAYTVDG